MIAEQRRDGGRHLVGAAASIPVVGPAAAASAARTVAAMFSKSVAAAAKSLGAAITYDIVCLPTV
ncbi:hypothetical protein AWB90_04710 [Mycobacterium paraense]|uniref:Uncharacterized protein n=1 Tax=Mycobacterium paraense TaxID=767916 RepID=A0A1X2AK97_9MYCO|nr:hypothetical protein AWB90_04710 [Mycobacterium paraense]